MLISTMDVKRPRSKFILLGFQNNRGKECPQAYREKKQVPYKGKKSEWHQTSITTLESRR